jgi:hypothetical protein
LKNKKILQYQTINRNYSGGGQKDDNEAQ